MENMENSSQDNPQTTQNTIPPTPTYQVDVQEPAPQQNTQGAEPTTHTESVTASGKRQVPWLGLIVIAVVLGIGFYIVRSEKFKPSKNYGAKNVAPSANNKGSGEPLVAPEKIISGVPPYMSPNPKSPKKPVTHTAGNQTSGYFSFTAPYDWQVTTLNFAQGLSSVLMQKGTDKIEITKVKKETVIPNFDTLSFQTSGGVIKIASYEDVGTEGKYRRIMAPNATDKSLQMFIVTNINGSWSNETPYGYISYQADETMSKQNMQEADSIVASLAPKTVDPNTFKAVQEKIQINEAGN